MTFSSDADFMTVAIENNAPNQLMDFFLQSGDGPAEIDLDLVGEIFSVCKRNGKLEVSQ